MNGSIYVIKNTKNNKYYIGQTTMSLEERFSNHLKACNIASKKEMKLYKAMNDIGKENFYIEIIEPNIPKDQLDEREKYYINKFDSFHNGYNATSGGKGGELLCCENDVKLLKEMYLKNMTYKEMSKVFNVHEVTVRRALYRLGLKKNKNIPKGFLESVADIMTNKDIAEIYNVSPCTVGRAFKKYKIQRGTGCSNHLNKQNQK